MSRYRPTVHGHTHMVSAGHALAAQAGYAVLEGGGNAVDAAVASAMTLGVVQSDLVNIAGVAPIMVRQPTGEVTTISGVGRFPRAADIDLLIREHGGHVPQGVLRNVVPAAPDAYITALELYGTMRFGEVVHGALQAAQDGFIMHELMAQTIAENEDNYRQWPANAAIYLPNGKPPKVGDNFVQADLGKALQYMADQEAACGGGRVAGLSAARDAFYKGDIAHAIVQYHEENGGWMTMADMADFRVGIEAPVTVKHRGVTLHACGAWCQGPSMAQFWSFLDGTDLASLGHNSPEYIHLLVEVIKLVFADRELHIGDPEFVDVPLDRLLSKAHAAEQLGMIRPDAVLRGEDLWGGTANGQREQAVAQDTSYTCVIDSDGLVASITPSDGSANTPVTPGWGINPSSRGSQNWAVHGHPSCVAPWKRPRLTPNPAIAETDDGVLIPFGTPGADVQCQAMLQVLLNITEFAMDPQDAVEAPRFATYSYPESFEPHEALPDVLRIESRIDSATLKALRDTGHDVQEWPEITWKAGAVCTIVADPGTGLLSGGADPRRPCVAIGR
ncbi:MAG: gamma-glutamyltransferase [Alphaproteobacteria bacterium]|nr:gamma-glutamyltransferase [Alphaproteobacteria bacterium]